MKVLVFTTLFPNHLHPNHGVFVKERMRFFASRSHAEIQVVAPVPYFPPIKGNRRYPLSQVRESECLSGFDVYHPRYFIPPKVGMVLYGLLMFLSVRCFISRLRERFAFDVIDAHFAYPDGFAAILLGWWFRKPVVITARGSDVNRDGQSILIRPLLRHALRRADRVIAVSHALKRAMINIGVPDEKIVVIPNGVDVAKFMPMSKKRAKERMGLDTKRVILFVGTINENKGSELILRAVKRLVHERRLADLQLVLIGDGPRREVLTRLIDEFELHDHVRLMGAVPHHVLVSWYNAADVLCLASHQEGMPNVVLESLACGTPVVATAVGGIPEVISSGKLGILTDREPDAIAEALDVALSRQWDQAELAQAIQPRTWTHVADSLRELFESICTVNRTSIAVPASTGNAATHK